MLRMKIQKIHKLEEREGGNRTNPGQWRKMKNLFLRMNMKTYLGGR